MELEAVTTHETMIGIVSATGTTEVEIIERTSVIALVGGQRET